MALLIESETPFYYNVESAKQLQYKDYRQKVAMTRDITDSIADNTNRSIAANALFTESINSRIINALVSARCLTPYAFT